MTSNPASATEASRPRPTRQVDATALRRLADAWRQLGWLPEREQPIGWRLVGLPASVQAPGLADRLPDALRIPGLRHFFWTPAGDAAPGTAAGLPGASQAGPWPDDVAARCEQLALLDHLVTDDPAAARLAQDLAVPVWWLGTAPPSGTVERAFTATTPSPTFADWAGQIGPVAAMHAAAHPAAARIDPLGDEQAAVQACFDALQRGDAARAQDGARRLLVIHPQRGDLWHLLGVLAQQAGQLDLAVACFTVVTQRTPGYPKGWQGLALAEWARGHLGEALAAVQHAVAAAPADASLRTLHARLLQHSGHCDLAATEASNALALRPDDPEALQERADALARLGRHEEAARLYRQALQQRPGALDLHFHLGVVLARSGHADEALPHFDQVLASTAPQDALHLRSLAESAQAHADCAAWIPAVAAARRAHAARPDDQTNLRRLVRLERLAQHPERALAALDARADSGPLPPDLQIERALLAQELARWTAAPVSPEPGGPPRIAESPDVAAALLALSTTPGAPLPPAQDLRWLVEAGAACAPLAGALLEHLWQRQHRVAGIEGIESTPAAADPPASQPPRRTPQRRGRRRLRVAYAHAERADGRDAAWVQALLAEHDPARFEAWAVSWGRPDGRALSLAERADETHLRQVDLTGLTDRMAARQLADMDFDLLLDLEGSGPQQRSGVLARRVAPCQVGWIERQGSILPPWLDALITPKSPAGSLGSVAAPTLGDARIVTAALPPLRLLRRPTAGQPTPADTLTRRCVGLPERAPVLAAWSPCRWIDPVVFQVWMHLLRACPPAVLWLRDHPAAARAALRSAAESAGICAERLVFASPAHCDPLRGTLALADLHLAPGRIADPHSLGDALAAGVPSLTFEPDLRQLLAAGLDPANFLATDVATYERLALQHLHHPRELIARRRQFVHQLPTAPLFDLRRQIHQLEALLEELAARQSQSTANATT